MIYGRSFVVVFLVLGCGISEPKFDWYDLRYDQYDSQSYLAELWFCWYNKSFSAYLN